MRNTSSRRRAHGGPVGSSRGARLSTLSFETGEYVDRRRPDVIPEGKGWCEKCAQVVPLRKDGTLRAHKTRHSQIQCLGTDDRTLSRAKGGNGSIVGECPLGCGLQTPLYDGQPKPIHVKYDHPDVWTKTHPTTS